MSAVAETAAAEADAATGDTILTVRDLAVEFPRPNATPFRAVDGVSFELRRGETLGIVGESGSGKTMIALSLLGIVPLPGRIVQGSTINLMGHRIDDLPPRQIQKVRGNDIGMVFQDPMTGLNPVRSVGSQLTESVLRHTNVSGAEADDIAYRALDDVGIPAARDRLKAFPHELSGGLRQRAMIALALINHPDVIVADEPTTSLDSTIQAQILDLLRSRLVNATMILITHDLGVAAEICDRISVMYAGGMVETGTIAEVLANPRHPYTVGLLAAVPKFDVRRPELVPIPGQPPTADDIITGCSFAPRCSQAQAGCNARPELEDRGGRPVACWFPRDEAH